MSTTVITNQNKISPGIDMFKLLFTLLIPLLHINYVADGGTTFLTQYLARMGVPFFFCCTGFFLETNLQKSTERTACKKHCGRYLWLLCFWLPVVLLFWINNYSGHGANISTIFEIIQNILFLTPGYLWYLSAGIVGIFLYCYLRYVLKNNTIGLITICGVLYVIGCLGNSWSFTGFMPKLYYDIFLSTRNGLFFAFPLITMGALIKQKNISKMKYATPLAIVAFFVEVYFVRGKVDMGTDTSMYFTLPVLIYCIMSIALSIKIGNRLSNFLAHTRQWGNLFYCMQYPCFIAVRYFVRNQLPTLLTITVNYGALFVCTLITYIIIKKSNIKLLHKLV